MSRGVRGRPSAADSSLSFVLVRAGSRENFVAGGLTRLDSLGLTATRLDDEERTIFSVRRRQLWLWASCCLQILFAGRRRKCLQLKARLTVGFSWCNVWSILQTNVHKASEVFLPVVAAKK